MSEDSFCEDTQSDENGIIVQFFDLKDPLSRFKCLLEQLWHVSLTDYSVWLQGDQQLDETKSLIEHGVEGEGKVQIKLQLKITKDGVKMINIIDVLKPTDELADAADVETVCEDTDDFQLSAHDKCVQWIESKEFIIEKLRHGIPSDPEEWNVDDVKRWLQWVIKTFNLKDMDTNDWGITGKEVIGMSMEEFKKKVPHDVNGHFWTHLQILQKCGQAAVCLDNEKHDKLSRLSTTRVFYSNKISYNSVNLWRFLLDLLTDKAYYHVIRWVNNNGEFHMVRPDTVARLWGEKKQKSNMTYEKLSRALRYYYEGDMISKVPGKRFVYKFHCDVKEIIGYSPMELNRIFLET